MAIIHHHSTKVKPYVYCCRHKVTGHYYIGYRERNVLLDIPSTVDLEKYKTSSKIVRPFFDEYESFVLAEFNTGDDAYDLESKQVVKIPKSDFDQLKNIKYVGLNSKLRN